MGEVAVRKRYLRPLYLGIAAAAAGELFLFFVWGMWLFPEGDLLKKLAWVAVCSLGMGSALGALVDLVVIERLHGLTAAATTLGMAVLLIGVGCNYLCWSLDHQFQWWGGVSNPGLFFASGVVGTLILGSLYSFLLFSRRGTVFLDWLGI